MHSALLTLMVVVIAQAGGEQPSGSRRQDRYGDNLPPGAAIRMGTVRWRHDARISALAFASAGQILVSGGADNVIRFWKPDGSIIREIKAEAAVECLAFSPDGKTLAAGYFDRTIRLWDAASGQLTRKLVGHKAVPIQLAFSPDGVVLASATQGPDEIARFWEVSTGKEISKIEDRESRHRGMSTVAFSPDGKLIATAGGEGSLFLWDASTGKNLRELSTGYWVRSMVFSPDSRTIALGIGAYQGRIGLVEVAEKKPIRFLTLANYHQAVIDTVAYSPDGKALAWGSRDTTARLWSPATGKEIATLKGHMGHVNAVAFSADGKTLATASSDQTIRLWDAATGKEKATGEWHWSTVWSTAFSPDGKTVVSAGRDHTVRLWEAATGKPLHKLVGHTSSVCSVAFTPDGKTLVSGSWDHTVRLWDVFAGKERKKLEGHRDAVRCVAVAADGRSVASGSSDATVLVWDLP